MAQSLQALPGNRKVSSSILATGAVTDEFSTYVKLNQRRAFVHAFAATSHEALVAHECIESGKERERRNTAPGVCSASALWRKATSKVV
ncbi:hypothetical protein EVAR_57290_1 [Eumeta japonica]|uniref:Uncharacterized protein n=1 Tax=Eumeta variegata TaxID=151549 RepID=A0A4C1YQY8_EUMVA|nr:hypothetical protein EVAR_57290_1 [Eumeta japonica]